MTKKEPFSTHSGVGNKGLIILFINKDPVKIMSLLRGLGYRKRPGNKNTIKKKDSLNFSGLKPSAIFYVNSGLNGYVNHLDLPGILINFSCIEKAKRS